MKAVGGDVTPFGSDAIELVVDVLTNGLSVCPCVVVWDVSVSVVLWIARTEEDISYLTVFINIGELVCCFNTNLTGFYTEANVWRADVCAR